jgi:hypothetical protein
MTDPEKLKHLIKHWIEHNNAHIQTYSEWAEKAESFGEKDLPVLFDQIIVKSRELNGLFKKALTSF